MTSASSRGVTAATVVATAVFAAVLWQSWAWVGASFPGFFVLANRVVAAVTLPGWLPTQTGAPFHQEVLAVDGIPVADAADVYERVRRQPPGTPFRYTLRASDGTTSDRILPSRQFAAGDHLLVLGTAALNGLLCLIIGLTVFRLQPNGAPGRALFAATFATAGLLITGLDPTAPHWCLRLHALAQAMLPATLMHVALVFPTDRLGSRRLASLFVYLPCIALAGVYQLALDRPAEYTALHLIASAGLGVAGAATIGLLFYDLCRSPFPLVRRRIGLVLLGAVGGIAPIAFVNGSAVLGERFATNGATLTTFLFPLAAGYAMVKQDLLEMDLALRRSLTQVVILLLMALLQLGALAGAQYAGWPRSSLSEPIVFTVLNLALLLSLDSVRERVRRSIDRVVLRHAYNAENGLVKLSHALARAQTAETVARSVQEVLRHTLDPVHVAIFLQDKRGSLCRVGNGEGTAKPFTLPPAIQMDLDRGHAVICYRWEDGTTLAPSRIWTQLRAEVLVPMQAADTIGLLALGRKRCGTAYNGDDVGFLHAAASQTALAFANATAFSALRDLNASLERQVDERTAAVCAANGELNAANAQLTGSLAELQRAYDQLEQNHTCLLRAERLATLGRLTAGIAHEVNTPLSAVQNALKVLIELGHEYAASIDDPAVQSKDHHEIAAEIINTAGAATEWARKAALFIRSTKVHGRNPGDTAPEPFSLAALATEVRDLLMHRLRAAGCQLRIEETGPSVSVVGSRAAFSQVLLNLITNALDAYEDAGIQEQRIVIAISQSEDTATVEVHDWAGGIPLQVLPRIFEEMFTTKRAGRGTGLGLWISRTIVEKEFGGVLDVLTSLGEGSRFIATLPLRSVAPPISSSAAATEDAARDAA